jgi:hypothetical protein
VKLQAVPLNHNCWVRLKVSTFLLSKFEFTWCPEEVATVQDPEMSFDAIWWSAGVREDDQVQCLHLEN